MRTTVTLPDDLLRSAKVLAAESDRTVSSVVEEALRRYLDQHQQERAPRRIFDLPTVAGEVLPGIDLNDNSAVLDYLDELDRSAVEGIA